ncbi:MAG: hypothetical protein ACRDSP_21740 [Pseudonocardiaceae bacterium]
MAVINPAHIVQVYSTPETKNAWARIKELITSTDTGWRRVQTLTSDGVSNTFNGLGLALVFSLLAQLPARVETDATDTFIFKVYVPYDYPATPDITPVVAGASIMAGAGAGQALGAAASGGVPPTA